MFKSDNLSKPNYFEKQRFSSSFLLTLNTLVKTEIIYPKNVGALVAIVFT